MGELDMYRQLGKTPNYSELARRYGIDRHTVSRYFNKEVFEQDLRSAKTSAFESFRELITEKASLPGMTKIAVYEYLLFVFLMLNSLSTMHSLNTVAKTIFSTARIPYKSLIPVSKRHQACNCNSIGKKISEWWTKTEKSLISMFSALL